MSTTAPRPDPTGKTWAAMLELCERWHATLVCLLPTSAVPAAPPTRPEDTIVDWLAPRFHRGF